MNTVTTDLDKAIQAYNAMTEQMDVMHQFIAMNNDRITPAEAVPLLVDIVTRQGIVLRALINHARGQ